MKSQNIDELIAIKIMGWHKEHREGLWTVTECYAGECDVWVDDVGAVQAKAEDDDYVMIQSFHPSTIIYDAFRVVKKLKKKGWKYFTLEFSPEIPEGLLPYKPAYWIAMFRIGEKMSISSGNTETEAICLSALETLK